jgi:hypothetical protein
MTPHWLVVEKLVVDLGGVCASHHGTRQAAELTEETVRQVDEAVSRATAAVTALLRNPCDDDGSAVRTASQAIAQAQDVIGRLQHTMERSRALRERAQTLQDDAARLRRRGRK